jgi:hypothetical protein
MVQQHVVQLGINEIIGSKREPLLQLAAQYGAYNVRVFGSVARGEAREDSDVDLLMSFPDDTSIFDLVGLWLDLKALLGREVNLSTDDGLRDYIRTAALHDAVLL